MANEFKIKNGLVVSGSADIEQDLTVRGTITADQLNISIVSSSVIYESGSTKFGDSIDDKHSFTGSVNITGSINLNGQAIGTGKLDETTFNSFTSSYNTVSGSINTRLGDLESFSSSLDGNFITEGEFGTHTSSMNSFTSSTLMTIGALNTESSSIRSNFNSFTSSYTNVSSSLDERIGDLESFSSSLDTSFVSETEFGSHTSSINGRVGNLETESGSIRSNFNSFTSSYNSVSTSIDSRLDTLETLSGSFTGSFSGSFNGDGTNLYNIPASGVTGLNLTQIADGSVTASVSNTNGLRVNSKTEITGSLIVTNGITGSIDYSNITNKPTLVSGSSQIDITSTTGYSTFSSSVSSSIGSLSSSIATTTNDLDGRLDNVETSTGSLNSFTSSINTTIKNKLNTENVVSGSSQISLTETTGYSTFSSSISSSVGSLSSSVANTTNDLDGRLDNVETSTGSLNNFTSSIDTTIKNKLNTEGVISGSVQVTIGDTTGFSTFSSSVSTSIGSLSSSVATIDNTQDGRLSSLEIESGSIRGDFNTYTGSNDTTNSTQNNRLTSLEGKSGSYATTGSNTFVGSQTISGSVIIRENLTVLGSSSITYTTSSQLRVDDNVIVVNTASPAERFGGLQVYDSGSIGEATGSLFWDSQKNRWVYQQSSESTYGGGVLLSGPRSSGSLGDELTLTSGKIARSAGGDHLNDSIITEYGGTTIGIGGSLEITGSIISTITPLVSGSSQVSFNGITDKPTLVSGSSQVLNGSGVWSGSAQLPNGVVSGSSQVSFNGITDKPTLVSGSEQVSFNGITDKPTLVSGSSQIDLTSTTNYSSGIKTRLNAEGVISGSSQISFGMISAIPSGLVSGSSQVLYSGLSGVPSGIVSGSSQVLNGSGVWSGSAQLPSGVVSGSSQVLSGTGIWSGSAQLPAGVVSGSSQVLVGTTIHSGSFFNGITVVSGSGQISFSGIAGVPSGLVSGSSQVSFGGLNGVPGGLVSGSSQISFGSIINVPSGLVSGSSQISFSSISGVPTGLVSGSSQISIASTTGFGTYINQALLTTSTPSFSTVTATTFTGNLVGNASTATSATTASSATSATNATFATNSSKLYSTDTSYSYTSGAPYFGFLTYDGTYWQFKVSPATPDQVRVYTADRLGGFSYSNSSGANTIVQRDSNGYIQNNYFYTSGGGSERNASGISYFAGFNSSDYYIRSYTVAAVQSALGLGTAAYVSANQSLNTSSDPTFANVYVNDWFRNNATNEGLYNQANGNHFYSTSGSDWVVTGAGGGVALQFRSNHQTTVRGYVHGDTSSNFGLLDNTGNWQVRCNPGNAGGQLYNGWTISGNFIPTSNNSFNLGSSSVGWANIYTNDLHLSNMNKPEGNDIDGTNGTWTIQEGAENLYIINNRNNKKFKITLEEII